MIIKEDVYIEIGEVKIVDGIKLRAVRDTYEPHLSCRYCCFNSPSLVSNCFNVSCQASAREDRTGVVFEFVE